MSKLGRQRTVLKPQLKRKDGLPSEHYEQAFFVNWFRKQFPDRIIFAIPNGGGRTKSDAGKLKVEGVLAGVPDLFIPSLRLFIEMKRQKGGSVSTDQKKIMEQLEREGYVCVVCFGCDHAKEVILARI